MKAEFINPFIVATTEVLSQETGRQLKISKGPLAVLESSYTSMDVTVMIGVTGAILGIVMYGMSERTAKNIVSAMLGQPVPIMDRMVESAIAEMGNVITGIASRGLEKAGYPSTLAPPTLIVGRGVMISTINITRIQIPLQTEIGDMEISVALKEFKSYG
ncbi:MAG: chemotaxis protein CheX [Firmicutes bacterium HGW-Firmicutes-14]|nr:MAG: chemotaxis protein CheX [Firmicutes bacterium HGW-Firmicutes-14]